MTQVPFKRVISRQDAKNRKARQENPKEDFASLRSWRYFASWRDNFYLSLMDAPSCTLVSTAIIDTSSHGALPLAYVISRQPRIE
jgi:hypothetical protein